jgi:hypothetical protein
MAVMAVMAVMAGQDFMGELSLAQLLGMTY